MPYLEADELTDIAEYYMTGRQDAKANEAIRAAIRMHPDSVDPQIFLARQKMYYDQLDEARAIIDGISEQDDCEILYIRAEILIKENRVNEASDFLLAEMKQMQDCLDSYTYECLSIFMDYDLWEMADEWWNRLLDIDPENPQLPIMKAEILMGLDDYEEALPMLQEILDNEPYNSEAWNLLAETYVALDMYSKALEASDFSLAINPQDSNALLMKGNAYMNDERMGDAIECYTRYLELQPDDFNVEISLGLCYSSEERHKEVLDLLDRAEQNAMRLRNKNAELTQVYQMRAYSLSRLERTAEAIAAIDQAIKLADDGQAWRLDLTKADIYLLSKQMKQAEACFLNAIEKSTEKGDTLFNIALIYSNQGYEDYAIELLDDVWTLFGTQDGKFVVPYLANCYMHKKDMENFLTYLKMAPYCDREATILLFRDRFPGIAPEDYYAYAYKEIYGIFPKE